MNLDISLTEALLSMASVAAGAFAGGLLRGLLSKLRGRYTGTACSNMLACFALGIMLARVDLGALVHLPYWEIAFGTGFCGALSTLATLARELGNLTYERAWIRLSLSTVFTVLGGLGAVWLGWLLGMAV